MVLAKDPSCPCAVPRDFFSPIEQYVSIAVQLNELDNKSLNFETNGMFARVRE